MRSKDSPDEISSVYPTQNALEPSEFDVMTKANSVSEKAPNRNNMLGSVRTSAIFAVMATLFVIGCGSSGSTPTGPSPASPERISAQTKSQASIATQDILDRIIPAMNHRGYAAYMDTDLRELNAEIQRDGRTPALFSLPLIRARAATWSAAEPAHSNDRINLVVIQLYLEWVERTI